MKKILSFVLYISSFLLYPSSFLHAKPFVSADIMGQLGNQMFIIAAGTSLALDNGAEPIFPDLATETQWRVPITAEHVFWRVNKESLPKIKPHLFLETTFHYEPIPYKPNMVIRGWFQSEKYFINHKAEILALFAPSQPILDFLSEKYGELLSNPKTVSIHFRSYEMEPNNEVYYKCDMDYYKKAIEYFPEDSLFVVFSNRIDWCKENFKDIPRNFQFIENDGRYHDFYDLYLMSFCRHNIICNSSFSWWAAYLNPNPNKIVLAPPGWLNPDYKPDTQDLIPQEWIIVN